MLTFLQPSSQYPYDGCSTIGRARATPSSPPRLFWSAGLRYLPSWQSAVLDLAGLLDRCASLLCCLLHSRLVVKVNDSVCFHWVSRQYRYPAHTSAHVYQLVPAYPQVECETILPHHRLDVAVLGPSVPAPDTDSDG